MKAAPVLVASSLFALAVTGACIRPFASKDQILGTTSSTASGTGGGATTTTGVSSSTGFPTCANGIKDGGETGIDCGGEQCAPCALGGPCNVDDDCVHSGTGGAGGGSASDIHCIDNICSPPLRATWIERNVGSPPPFAPNAGPFARFAFYPPQGVSLLYGGTGVDASDITDMLWAWDGQVWSNIPLEGTQRAFASYDGVFVYDSNWLRVFLIPGANTVSGLVFTTQVYQWDGEIMSPALSTSNMLTPRHAAAAAYDPVKKETVMIGGVATGPELDETWALPTQSLGWVVRPPAPVAAIGWGAAYDTKHSQLVLVGGATANSVIKRGTYLWDGTSWKTAPLPPTEMCDARMNFGIAYDSRRKRVVVYGGYSDNETTCEWDGTSWTNTTPAKSPTGGQRNGPAMTFDPIRGRVYMTGPQADIWEYSAYANGCVTDGDCDTGHCVDGLCCNAAKCGECQACNVDVTHAGTCTNVPAGTLDPDTCTGTCNGNGVCSIP